MVKSLQIQGRYNGAIVFTDKLEDGAYKQILELCNQPFVASSKIRIMPDVHAGKGCTIGTTMTVKDKIVPNLVGVDIGCGLLAVELQSSDIDFKGLDDCIYRQVPSGRNIRPKAHAYVKDIPLNDLKCGKYVDRKRAELSVGTLGGGNHFIECGRAQSNGALWLIVHSGSRRMGPEIAEHYQQRAIEKHPELPKALAYVEGRAFDDYLYDMDIARAYAEMNRLAMLDVICAELGLRINRKISTIHNYLDTRAMILRKGAVSARYGEELILPLNMRDGSLICIGKGADDWNMSAPHGAGRLMSRSQAKRELDLADFKTEMRDVYTTSVHSHTLDEAPGAYKAADDIIRFTGDTLTIADVIKPLYNFKAAG